MRDARVRAVARFLAVAVPTLTIATVAVAVLQDSLRVPNPSAVYLVAVVATAIVSGTLGAVATSVAAFGLYNFLFTEPRYTLHMQEPGVFVSVVLLLFVGIVVGQLTALQRTRAETARQREQEARALFSVSRRLVTRESVQSVLAEVANALQADARMTAVWITLGLSEIGDSIGVLNQLRRMPGEAQPQWVRVHQPRARARQATELETYRVAIEAGAETLGAIWASRPRAAGAPGVDETRLLAATADQLGQAIAHDRMAADTHSAEVARESDALKSALLQSVSHDLRTPLATIRAAAGTLRPVEANGDSNAQRESVEAIEREVEYLNRLVSNLLDLSRIEAGALRAVQDVFELDDLVKSTLDRLGRRLEGWAIENLATPALVAADPVFFEAVLTNVLENALRHTAPGTMVRITTSSVGVAATRLTVEDSGTGVPAESLDRIFERFYRGPARRSARSGTGIGLTVARGLVEQMGGHISGRRWDLGGLAIDIDLPSATMPGDATQPPIPAIAS